MKSKELYPGTLNVYLKLFSDLLSATTNYANLHVKDSEKFVTCKIYVFSPACGVQFGRRIKM